MSETSVKPKQVALPSDFPARTIVFPDPISRLIYGIFGIQARVAEAGQKLASEFKALLSSANAPGGVEHLKYVDPQGSECDVFLTFWSDAERHKRWFAQPAVCAWWRALPITGEVGVWREVMNCSKDYYQFGGGGDRKGGIGVLGELAPTDKFGYWGGYRDRVPASTTDKFRSPLIDVPDPTTGDTLGRRLSVDAPDNICFIREAQAWDTAGPEERKIWMESMEPVVDRWVTMLRDKPQETGCLSMRHCAELDVKSGTVLERQSQIVFLLSLKHIERAARSTHTHLAVKKTYTEMYTEPKFKPQMHAWVEMLIAKKGELETEYVNCHPMTGLLPYFESREVDI